MNEGIKLSNRELEFINLFELISSVKVKDCIIDEKFNRAIFLVEPTQVGIAIGKGGEKINAFKKLFLTSLRAAYKPAGDLPIFQLSKLRLINFSKRR